MGQAARQSKYNKFWKWCNRDEGALAFGTRMQDAIDMLLRTLTDDQLDGVLADITAADGFGLYSQLCAPYAWTLARS